MKKFFERMKRDDGFTLVELLIATAVLTVIMVPLMRAFTIAANTMAQGVNHGKATVAMENTAELISASSFGSIDDLVPMDPSAPSSVEKSLLTLTPFGSKTLEVKEFNSNSYVRTSSTITNEMVTDTGSAAYTVLNADMAGGNGLVDVIITPIDSTAAVDTLGHNDLYKSVNSSDYSSFTAMDKTWLQIGLDPTKAGGVNSEEHVDFIAYKYLKENKGWTDEQLQSVQRTIEITIKDGTGADDVPSGYDMAYYKVEYKYKGSTDTEYIYENTLWDGYAYTGTDSIFSVQLVYLPLYGTTITDEIVITNEDDLPCKFFLIKQNMIGSTHAFNQSKTVAASDDEAYKLNISLKEGSGDGASGQALRLFTNVHEVIYDNNKYITKTNIKFTYSNSGTTASTITVEDMLAGNQLVDDASGGRGYNILVRVYELKNNNNYELLSELKTVKLM